MIRLTGRVTSGGYQVGRPCQGVCPSGLSQSKPQTPRAGCRMVRPTRGKFLPVCFFSFAHRAVGSVEPRHPARPRTFRAAPSRRRRARAAKNRAGGALAFRHPEVRARRRCASLEGRGPKCCSHPSRLAARHGEVPAVILRGSALPRLAPQDDAAILLARLAPHNDAAISPAPRCRRGRFARPAPRARRKRRWRRQSRRRQWWEGRHRSA
jgi:hypothetical protein